MSLTTAERTTLKLLLDSLAGDVVAIDTLFGVSGGTPPPNTAERASLQNMLKALAGHQSGIDSLFGLTPDGSGSLSTAERASADNLLRALSGDPTALDSLGFGGSLVFSGLQVILDSWIWDSGLFTPTGVAPNDYHLHDAQCGMFITMSDTSLTIVAVGGGGAPGTGVDVYVNGVYNQTALFNTLGVSSTVVCTLPVGAKIVEIREGQAHVQQIGATAFTVIPQSAPSSYMVFVGDSITAGANSSPDWTCWLELVRHAGAFGGVLNSGHSGFSMTSYQGADNFDSFVASMGQRLKGSSLNFLHMALGTNDYGITSETPTTYAAMVVTAMTKLHAAYPSLNLSFETAIPRGTETANPGGFTCQQYRDAVYSTVPGSCPYVRILHGETLTGITLDVDGLHPVNAGHVVKAADELTFFGRMSGALAASVTVPTFVGAATIVGGFQPNSVAGNKLWLRADASNVALNSGDVATWTDRSGLGNDGTQPTGANQPLWVSSSATFNNLPCVTFTRANSDFIICDGIGAMVSGTAKPYDIYVVMAFVAGAVTKSIVSFGRSTVSTPFVDLRLSTTATIVNAKSTDAAVTTTLATTQTPSAATAHIIRFSSDGLNATTSIDGVVSSVSSVAEAVGAMTVDRFTLGGLRRNGAPTNSFDGSIAEVIAYDNQISAGNNTSVIAYLKALYNIP